VSPVAGDSALAEVLGLVRAQPGIGVRGAVEASNRAPMTVRAALKRLDALGAIAVRSGPGKRVQHFAVTGLPQPGAPRHLQPLLSFMAEQGREVTPSEARKHFGDVPEITIRHRLTQLERSGFVQLRRVGRRLYYSAA